MTTDTSGEPPQDPSALDPRIAEFARHEAEHQKRLLHSLFMQAPTLIALLRGPQHIVELANPPICQMWGKTEDQILDRALFDVLPELREQVFRELLAGVYRTGVPHLGKETSVRFDRGDGVVETVYLNFVYSPFRNAEGEIEGVFVVANDVTEQVSARHEVNDLRKAAESANRAKDEFLAMLGHELRNPLSPIVTALHLMKLRCQDSCEAERTIIERQVSHLTRLVDDLLDVSRIAQGKVKLKQERVELAEVVARAIEMASPLLEQRTHQLTLDVPTHGLAVKGDPTRLSQVVSNLLTNAAKYTPAGGQISIKAEEAEGHVLLRVTDSGIGIKAAVLPHIFNLFVQARQAIDRSQGGLGLGLTIVRNLIERHGGTVSAHSAGTGKGSEFVVRLPKAFGRKKPDRRKSARWLPTGMAAPPQSPARRILVVDDNHDGAEMLSLALQGKGHSTRVAYDALEALRVAEEFCPEVAVLDIGLPVMNGYELAASLRRLPGLAGVKLIALTGYGQDSDRVRASEAGFEHHVVKPVDIDAIESMVNL